MVNFNDLTSEQLLAAVQAYPWFSAARVQLCMKTASESGLEAADSIYKESRVFVPNADSLALRLHNLVPKNYSDADLSAAIRDVMETRPRVVMAGMDFFSRDDYDSERQESDATISRIALVDYNSPLPEAPARREENVDLVSETLAQIYADQGHPERAKEIYIKLSLQSPEKSAYFASLIDNLNS